MGTLLVQCGAVWCSVVQCGAVWCSVVQCGAMWYSMVQYVAVLQAAGKGEARVYGVATISSLMHVAVCCSVLQCVAVGCCSVLQG